MKAPAKELVKVMTFRVDAEVIAAVDELVRAEGGGAVGRKRSNAIRKAIFERRDRLRAEKAKATR